MDDFPGMFTSVSSGRHGSTIESYILARSGGGFFTLSRLDEPARRDPECQRGQNLVVDGGMFM